jgi:isopentenyldiphosphate isomerase
MREPLEIVDEQDQVIGTAERSDIHAQGLLHREVHVFVTDGTRIALQRRSAGARSWQGYLDATVGGHVELGESYVAAALHEAREELGLVLTEADLIPIEKLRIPARDAYNGYHNNVWRMIYGYRLKAGEVLTPETGKSDGFEWFTLAEIHHAAFLEEKKCIPVIADELYIRCYRALLSST